MYLGACVHRHKYGRTDRQTDIISMNRKSVTDPVPLCAFRSTTWCVTERSTWRRRETTKFRFLCVCVCTFIRKQTVAIFSLFSKTTSYFKFLPRNIHFSARRTEQTSALGPDKLEEKSETELI